MSPRRIAALLAVALAATTACRKRPPERQPDEDELWVTAEQLDRRDFEIVAVSDQDLPQVIAAAGRVAFDDLRVQHVLSPVAGRVTRVLAAPGERVRPGAPLVTMASPEIGQGVSDLVKAEADVAQAEADLTRQRRLTAADAASQRDLEAAEDAQRKAGAELDRARQKVALFRSGTVDRVTQELTLRSAIEGTVVARNASPGTEVQGASSGGTPNELFTVGDIDEVWVLADFAEADASRVRVGARAQVRVAAWPGRIFEGTVGWVAATLDPALRTGRVRVSVANRDHALRPKMLAQVAIDVPPRRALAVDRRAIVPFEGATFAYAAEAPWKDGRQPFRRRRVRVGGDPGAQLAVVEEGLASGDSVAVERPKAGGTEDGLLRITAKQLERAGIRVAKVAEQQVEDSLAAGARIAFDDVRVGHVFSPVTGRVTKLLAAPGERVAKGAPLVTIVSPDVGAAFSDALKAEADQVAAAHEANRQRELFAAHAGSRRDLEAAEAALRKADAELERARQKTRLLSAGSFDRVTQQYTLRSPLDGVVVARGASPGLEVQGQWNGAGTPVELFTIGAQDPLWIVGDVFEMDLPHVRPGQAAEVHVPAFPGRTFRGRVEWVSDVIDPATHMAKVRCTVPNPDGALRPEMAPVLQIALPAHRHLAVPRDAVVRLGEDTVLFVLAEKTASGDLLFRRRPVVVGDDRPNGLVPILEGIAPSDQVVVSGAIFLVGLL